MMANEKICPNCGTHYGASMDRCPTCDTPFYDLTMIEFGSCNPAFFKIRTTAIGGKQVDVTFKAIPRFEIELSSDRTGNGLSDWVSGGVELQIVRDMHGNLFTAQERGTNNRS